MAAVARAVGGLGAMGDAEAGLSRRSGGGRRSLEREGREALTRFDPPPLIASPPIPPSLLAALGAGAGSESNRRSEWLWPRSCDCCCCGGKPAGETPTPSSWVTADGSQVSSGRKCRVSGAFGTAAMRPRGTGPGQAVCMGTTGPSAGDTDKGSFEYWNVLTGDLACLEEGWGSSSCSGVRGSCFRGPRSKAGWDAALVLPRLVAGGSHSLDSLALCRLANIDAALGISSS